MKAGTIIKPLNRKVVVVLDPREEQSAGGIVLPETSREASQWGTVEAVAPDCEIITDTGVRVLVISTQGTNIGGDTIIIGEEQIKAMEIAA